MQVPDVISERVVLRSWRTTAAAWYVHARDDEVFRWTTEPRTLTVEEAAAGIALAEQSENLYCFAITDRTSGELAGNLPVEVLGDRATIAYWLAASWRGRGHLGEALELLLAWLPSLGVAMAELEVMPTNNASIRTVERAAFAHSGERPHPKLGRVLVYERTLT